MKKRLKVFLSLCIVAAFFFLAATFFCLKPVTSSFDAMTAESANIPVSGRNGEPLAITYQTRWNRDDIRALHDLPPLLVNAFTFSEDRRFYDHGGVDWAARGSALWQNLRYRRTVRGASTITEQVVRMINPRPRTLWSKWLEGIEAALLERHADKAGILEFYLNQVPYASNRRGVVQAARFYFNRDPQTLSVRESLALAVLARAPSAYDLRNRPDSIEKPLVRLADQMRDSGLLTPQQYRDFALGTLGTSFADAPVNARHFARFVQSHAGGASFRTTLDAALQAQVQDIIDGRLKKLSSRNVRNAGALVVDHENGQILAWVVGGANDAATKGGDIDTVTTPRQPGSALKPFLYAGALEKGWTAATLVNDSPVAQAVGAGLHRFRNYSNTHYGPITVREALGNSLNIPAILTVQHVGVPGFLDILHRCGFESLDRGVSVYDEGLALGNGEVTLLEMVRAYSVLANKGQFRDLRLLMDDVTYDARAREVFSPETTSIISNILSDPRARALEFGSDSVLNLPYRTAIKTGTSTDYRDAWTIGYNDRYTVGIWMGNLDRTPMREVTGSTGPALALRGIFQILNERRDVRDLYMSRKIVEREVCIRPEAPDGACPTRTEIFAPGTELASVTPETAPRISLVRPTAGLRMARDPRIPEGHQKFRFELSGLAEGQQAEWILNGRPLARSGASTYLWPLEKGRQSLKVAIYEGNSLARELPAVTFTVK